jgi:hypothetical protein
VDAWGGAYPMYSHLRYDSIAETGHLALSAQQNWGRLRRIAVLGTAKTAGEFVPTLQLAYDYGAYVDTLAPTLAPEAVGLPLQFRARMPRQRMEAVRFLLTWPLTALEDMQVQAIALEVAPRQGVWKLPAAQSV